jgi:hypothetical protein
MSVPYNAISFTASAVIQCTSVFQQNMISASFRLGETLIALPFPNTGRISGSVVVPALAVMAKIKCCARHPAHQHTCTTAKTAVMMRHSPQGIVIRLQVVQLRPDDLDRERVLSFSFGISLERIWTGLEPRQNGPRLCLPRISGTR